MGAAARNRARTVRHDSTPVVGPQVFPMNDLPVAPRPQVGALPPSPGVALLIPMYFAAWESAA